MSTFKLKKTTNTILAYKLNGRTHRKYDNLMTEEFAIAYLTNGSEKEIAERKKLFAILPDAFKSKKELKEVVKEEIEIVVETKTEEPKKEVAEVIAKTQTISKPKRLKSKKRK